MNGYSVFTYFTILLLLKFNHGQELHCQQLAARLQALESNNFKNQDLADTFEALEMKLENHQVELAAKDTKFQTQINHLQDELALKSQEVQTIKSEMINTETELRAEIQQLKTKLSKQHKIGHVEGEQFDNIKVTNDTTENIHHEPHARIFQMQPNPVTKLQQTEIINKMQETHVKISQQQPVVKLAKTQLQQLEEKLQNKAKKTTEFPKHLYADTYLDAEAIVKDGNNFDQNRKNNEYLTNKSSSDQVIRKTRLVIDRANAPVAFHAVLDGGRYPELGRNEHIKYDNAILNLGDAYHPNSGTFVAPHAGLYLLSAAILTGIDDITIVYADLTKNGDVLARLHAVQYDGYALQTSITIVAVLEAGDQVWVNISGTQNVTIWGEHYSYFSGALIHDLQ